MGQEPSTGRTAVTSSGDPEEIREEIEATRQQLGDTVEALSAKTDVKAQAKAKVDQVKTKVAEFGNDTQAKAGEAKAKAADISPDAARSAATQAGQKARENPLAVAAIAAFAAGFLLGRLSRS
jgi:ElaB/YqjD/DUF883 family membrane-anchored ribosome-binding protein